MNRPDNHDMVTRLGGKDTGSSTQQSPYDGNFGKPKIAQWSVLELTFESARDYANAYTDAAMVADFTGPQGELISRPAFWDVGHIWRVRFTPPTASGQWSWRTRCSEESDIGLHGQHGAFTTVPSTETNPLLRAGPLRMSPGHRSVVHSDGTPFFLAGDTAWSLPWRGTQETVQIYAEDRQSKGFNCTLLMCIQPDRDAVGPRDRCSPGGFDVAFEDLSQGHINQLNPEYFQVFDKLVTVLLTHEIVPIYQPVFHGYGWKGLHAMGNDVDPAEYARFCRYLVARYGAQPAIWLVGADNNGLAPSVESGGREIHEWDAYNQPTGIHYSPDDKSHHNRSHQDAAWLDFQWCQTGHDGTDILKVGQMSENLPLKGVANGEPTYETIGDSARAVGWWQGDTAWSNFTSGGTMGVFYGAAALWQWKFTADEPGWPAWAVDHHSWRSALDLEGSTYVGRVAKALAGFDTIDMTKHPELAGGRMCVARPGGFYCVYLPDGGDIALSGLTHSLPYFWLDPKTCTLKHLGQTNVGKLRVSAPNTGPWVLLVGHNKLGPGGQQ